MIQRKAEVKSLFIVGNLIVIFLVGESKIFPSDSSRATDVFYNKCVGKTHRLRKDPITSKKRKVDIKKDFKEIRMSSVDEKGRREKQNEVEEEERENYLDAEDGEDEGLPAEELSLAAELVLI
ncbi:protein of unknown function DUF4408 [Dillenia turbinata]|uniref:DUF4408 domain-containing protein n=1 Tax=Dillenia turbinata TaxID=194707 RepID=A0AAN8V313_9MAGN